MVRTPASFWIVAVTLIALAALVEAVVGHPFAFVLVGIWGLIAFCVAYSRMLRKNGTSTRQPFRYNLCATGFLYLIPIGIATLFYVVLSLYISWYGDSLGVDRLIGMQVFFEDVSQFFSGNLKLNELTVFGLLIAIYLLSCVLLAKGNLPGMAQEAAAVAAPRSPNQVVIALHRVLGGYVKYSGAIAAGLATLASFTFFGMQLGEPSKDLQLRIKVLQQGYAEVARRTEAELSSRVANGLVIKIRGAFPPSYQQALALPAQIDGLVLDVQQHANSAKSRHGVSVPAVDLMIQEQQNRMKRVNGLESVLRVDGADRQNVPGGTTEQQVKAAREGLNGRPPPMEVELVAEGKRKIILQVEKIVTEKIVTLTKPLIEAVPILEPLIQTFIEAADQTLQERIGKSYDRAVNVALQNPGEFDAVIEREARTIVAQTNIETLVERAAPQAEQKSEQLRNTLSELLKSKPLIDKHVTEHLARQPRADLSKLLIPRHDFRLPDSYRLYRPPSYTPYRPPSSGYGESRITPLRPPTAPPRPAPRVSPRFFW